MVPLPPFSRDCHRIKYLVRFSMHVVRHRSDCGYPDVFGTFCFCRDDDDAAALFRGVKLERSLAGVLEDGQLREIRGHMRT